MSDYFRDQIRRWGWVVGLVVAGVGIPFAALMLLVAAIDIAIDCPVEPCSGGQVYVVDTGQCVDEDDHAAHDG